MEEEEKKLKRKLRVKARGKVSACVSVGFDCMRRRRRGAMLEVKCAKKKLENLYPIFILFPRDISLCNKDSFRPQLSQRACVIKGNRF